MICHNKLTSCTVAIVVLLGLRAAALAAEVTEQLPDSKVIFRALTDEMARSLGLQMEDLESPYFVQYSVDDQLTYQIAAHYGSITDFQRGRTRQFYSNVRVGSYEMDNTNFSADSGRFFFGGGGGAGAQASLPLDEDYTALRQAMWWATDKDYKDAVETLTKKHAYMKDKNIEDRPADFTKASVVNHSDPTAELLVDEQAWKAYLKSVSGHFKKHTQLRDSDAQFFIGAGNTYVVNNEGTRLRIGDSAALLILTAEVQCADGMVISGGLSYTGEHFSDLPADAEVHAEIDQLVSKLVTASLAPVLDNYTGPVLFDGHAAAQIFRHMIAEGVAGQVDPVGTQRRDMPGSSNLEKKLNKRILPKTMQIFDDPTRKKLDQQFLMGNYRFDAEGVQAERVDIIVNGELKNMVMSRVPTKEFSTSNGHARRSPGSGSPKAAIGCLFVEDNAGVSKEDLKKQLIEAAEDQDLEYAIRVSSIRSPGLGSSQTDLFSFFTSMQRGGGGGVPDPVFAYKVYVEDGREELIRGCEFGEVKLRDLKSILAVGNEPAVYNYIGVGFSGSTPPTSIIAPAILLEELDLTKIEQEHDKPPILSSPLAR